MSQFQTSVLPVMKQYFNRVIQSVNSAQRKARHLVRGKGSEQQDPRMCRKAIWMLFRIAHIGNSDLMGDNTEDFGKIML
jgi:hypothetical protein